jgi:hypothetical protein
MNPSTPKSYDILGIEFREAGINSRYESAGECRCRWDGMARVLGIAISESAS